jgi:hypothetical protein
MPIFAEGKIAQYHLKAIFPKICIDDGGVPYVEWYVSDEINEQCKRRSEAAKRGWKKRRAKRK